MTARDRWTTKLKCPQCGVTGAAELSQADGYAYMRGERRTSADELPKGFKVVEGAGDIDIFCVKCNVSAWK